MDMLAAVVWYAITAFAICAAWIAARRAFPIDCVIQRMMHTVVLVWTWIAIVSFALGTFGVLNAVSLGGGVLVAAVATWYWSSALPTVTSSVDSIGSVKVDDKSAQEFKTSVMGRGRGASKAWMVFWAGAAAFACVLVAAQALLQFPTDWDTLMYHRPLINHWLQTGSLYTPQCALWYVPGNNELLGLWWAAAFSGDFWVGLMNIPAALLLALGTYELARLIGISPLLRHATVIAVVGNSIVLLQITNAKNDIAVAGLFVAGLSYGFRYVQSRNRCDLLLGGSALGLTAGVKYYALGYAGVGWLGVMTMAWYLYGRRTALVVALSLAGIMLLPASYWYGRNLVATGTPLYPQGYSGPDIEEALMPRSAWRSSILGNGRPAVWPQYVEAVWRRGGICQTAAVLALPLLLTWSLISGPLFMKQRDPTDTTALRVGLAVVLAGAWIGFGVTPFTVDPSNNEMLNRPYILARFSQTPLALSVLALGLLLSDTSRWIYIPYKFSLIRFTLSALLPTVFAAAALATLCTSVADILREEWLTILLITTNIMLLSLIANEIFEAVRNHGNRMSRIMVPAFLVGMAAFVISTAWLASWWHGNFAAHYDVWRRTQAFSKLEKWNGQPPSIVTLDYRCYPYFGSRRQFYTSRPRRVFSKRFLLSYLASNKADTIAVLHLDPTRFKRYHESIDWVREHPEIFQEVDAGIYFDLYRIKQDRLQGYLNKCQESANVNVN